jgi:Protein of unknown function (DUF1573)
VDRPIPVKNTTTSTGKYVSSLSGPGHEYQIDADNCNQEIAPQQACTVDVSFAPTARGDRPTETLTVLQPSADGKKNTVILTATLHGQGKLPDLSVSSSSILFPPQRAGTVSVPQTITLTNNSDKTLAIGNVITSGDYSVGEITEPNLEPNQSLLLAVSFRPTQRHWSEGALVILSESSESPNKVTLSGEGVGAAPCCF